MESSSYLLYRRWETILAIIPFSKWNRQRAGASVRCRDLVTSLAVRIVRIPNLSFLWSSKRIDGPGLYKIISLKVPPLCYWRKWIVHPTFSHLRNYKELWVKGRYIERTACLMFRILIDHYNRFFAENRVSAVNTF